MRVHRFYVNEGIKLKKDFWLHDQPILWQWRRVLRFKAGQQVVLFDGIEHDRLYKITELTDREAHLSLVTEYARKLPKRHIYLAWSLLKKDKNEWVLQKATELGASHLLPLLAERSEKTGFNIDRARKIIIEAAEQCGRSDIPTVREPMHVETLIHELKDKVTLFICEQDQEGKLDPKQNKVGVLIGPEGGWSEAEKQLFVAAGLAHLNLHDFTLRAETASVAAVQTLATL
jgi:16S rRNA (uracil1498-N3)-methyltransferase